MTSEPSRPGRPFEPATYTPERPLRIVVGWDKSGSDGIELAAWFGKSLPISVSVISAAPRTWKKPISRKKHEKWLKAETEKFTRLADGVLKEHLPRSQWAAEHCTLIDAQDEAAALTEAAKRLSADIIFLGSAAKLKKARFLASSVAEAIMHSSPLPLGLAPKGLKLSKKGITRINYVFLRPDRGQDTSGLRAAARLAARLGVPLRLVSLSPEPPGEAVFDAAIGSPEEVADWHEASLSLLDLARDEVFAATSSEASAPLEVETCLANGSGWKKATACLKWKKGDLICLGSHPAAPHRRVFVGSRASEFLRFAPAPVVIYPRADA